MSSDIHISFEAKEVLDRMKRWQEVTGVETSKLLRDEMRLIVTRLMQAYPPFRAPLATSFAGQVAVGKAAVARDISRVYATSTEIFRALQTGADPASARGFYRAFQKGDFGEATRILRASQTSMRNIEQVGGPVQEALHRRARDARGRVRRHRPMQVVTSRARREYTREVQRRVGWAKAGWLHAAERLKAKGIPVAIRAHYQSPGHLIDAANKGKDPHIEARNFVKYVRQLDPGNRMLSHILRARVKAYERRTKVMVERAWKKR